jgi:hypothetical protein
MKKFGVQALGELLEGYAKEKGITFSKHDYMKQPGNYGGSTTYTFYQMGNKYGVVRYTTVPGAPRLNNLTFFVTEKPELTEKALAGVQMIDSAYEVRDVLDRVEFKQAEATQPTEKTKKWTKAQIDKFVNSVRGDLRGEGMSDDQAYDMAKNILYNENGLEDSIKKELKVTDVVGWLADKIYAKGGFIGLDFNYGIGGL